MLASNHYVWVNIWPCHDDRDTRTHIYILAGRKYIYFRQSEIYISWLTFSFLLASGICLSLQAFIKIFYLYMFIRRDNHSGFKKTQKERNNIVRAGYRNLKINQGNASGKKLPWLTRLNDICRVIARFLRRKRAVNAPQDDKKIYHAFLKKVERSAKNFLT